MGQCVCRQLSSLVCPGWFSFPLPSQMFVKQQHLQPFSPRSHSFQSQVASRLSSQLPVLSGMPLRMLRSVHTTQVRRKLAPLCSLQPHFPLLVSVHWASSSNWSPILGVLSLTRFQDKQGSGGGDKSQVQERLPTAQEHLGQGSRNSWETR